MIIKRYKDFTNDKVNNKLIIEGDEDDFDIDDDTTEDGDEDGDEEFSDDTEEVFNDNPESYIKGAILKLKRNLEGLFPKDDISDDEVIATGSDNIGNPNSNSDNTKMTLKDMGAKLESSDIAKSSKTHKSLVIKFSDTEFYYSLYIKLSLKEAIELINSGEELSDESIQNAFVKLKKISLDNYEEIGTVNRNVKVSEINEEFIINLKLELDGDDISGGDEEEFKIEL